MTQSKRAQQDVPVFLYNVLLFVRTKVLNHVTFLSGLKRVKGNGSTNPSWLPWVTQTSDNPKDEMQLLPLKNSWTILFSHQKSVLEFRFLFDFNSK